MTKWLQVTALFDQIPEDWAVACEAFSRFGLEGTLQTDDPPSLSAYLHEADHALLEGLHKDLLQKGVRQVAVCEIEEKNWAECWKEFFKPRKIGKRLVICPSWESSEASPSDLVITLDPGQAFGTGEHPTTRLCLQLLEETFQLGAKVADIGCGSGVLSIAAAKLGAAKVYAVDLDGASVESTKQNALLNGVEVTVHRGEGFGPLKAIEASPFDLILSNIISAALIGLAREAAIFLKPGGAWIISGVIEINWPDVLTACKQAGFKLEKQSQEDDWIAAIFRR